MLKNINGKSFIAFSCHALSAHVIIDGNGPHTCAGLCWGAGRIGMTSEIFGFLFPGAGSLALGGIVGVAAGYAVKKIFKIAIFVLGCFFGGLVWLSYKGLVSVNWNSMSNQTQEALTNVAIQAMKVTNQTAQQMQHNGFTGIDMGGLLPVAAGAGFLPGFFYGLTRG